MENSNTPGKWLRIWRTLIIAVVSLILVAGLVFVGWIVVEARTPVEIVAVDALASSTDECVDCHRDETPGIIQQYAFSSMASAEVACVDCHEVPEGYPGASEHEGTYVLGVPTTAMCQDCHEDETEQFLASRHGLPAYVAYAGAEGLSSEHLAMYEAIPEGTYNPDRSRNALYHLEGPAVTRFACETCHSIGEPAEDGSVGDCTTCHLRHEFGLEQVRKPETCNACHIGPDHPQWEIYQESPHGIAYMTMGHNWDWEAEPGTLDVTDFPAATCSICHMSGFGSTETTHDVGERLTWYLFASVSERRPNWESNMQDMQQVCGECHNDPFIEEFYADGDAATEAVNVWVREAQAELNRLKDADLLTAAPFDEPVDFLYFELWHHWGRTAKFGAWMQGPDYTQWHGAYELLSDMAELKEVVAEKLDAQGE